MSLSQGCHDTQYNDIQHNDQHHGDRYCCYADCSKQAHYDAECCSSECRSDECRSAVIMLSGAYPYKDLTNVCIEKCSLLSFAYNFGKVAPQGCKLPLSDVILAQLACPLSDVMFCLHSRITNLSRYKHWI